VTEILLIDDMAGVRRAVTAMLKRAGHSVTTVDSGSQGLDMLQSRRFDLVITDMLMPDTDGADVLSALQDMPHRPRVIAISGGGAGLSADSALRLARIKADAFLEKPFDSNDLLAAIDKLLAKTA
jgi:two-component system chemotaxis response regulator CheY